MENQLIIQTEQTSYINKNLISKSIKKSKKTLTLPLITAISNSLKRGTSHNKINNTNIGQKRVIKKGLNKKRNVTARSPPKKKYKINKDLDLVYKLNMEIDVAQLFEQDLKLKKEREKIDNNPDVKAKRLNLYKNANEKNGEKKMEIDPKEKEKYIEKEFKDELENFEKIKNECNNINIEINAIRKKIEEFKLDLNVFNKYGDLLDKKFMDDIKQKEKNKTEKISTDEIIEQSEEKEEGNSHNNSNVNSNKNSHEIKNNEIEINKKTSKNEKFEHINAFSQVKRQREERIKLIKQTMLEKEKELTLLEESQKNLIQQCKEKKTIIYKLRHQLLNIYHINLYEGLNFRTDGLCSLIRAIWNLGVNVDINYMPTYLDNSCIDYLFDRTKRLIEISKIRLIIEENEKEFEESIKQWKQINVNENSKDTDNLTDSNFFQTGVMEKYNYMDKYPKSKQFMEAYDKKYFPKHDKFEINLKKNQFKSKKIPYGIIEQHNNLEKLKYLLKNLIEQNDNKEKIEIERLCKEFLTNEYSEKYKVAVETIMGALCGEEKKNEGLNLFAKFQKKYKEGKKLIEFHKNVNKIK